MDTIHHASKTFANFQVQILLGEIHPPKPSARNGTTEPANGENGMPQSAVRPKPARTARDTTAIPCIDATGNCHKNLDSNPS